MACCKVVGNNKAFQPKVPTRFLLPTNSKYAKFENQYEVLYISFFFFFFYCSKKKKKKKKKDLLEYASTYGKKEILICIWKTTANEDK